MLPASDKDHKRNKNSATYAKKNSKKIKTTVRSTITPITQRNIGGNT